MQKNVVVGKLYTVTAADADCTVTDAEGRTLCTASAGEQKHFTATTSTITLSDPAAALTATFNRAASALRLLGGGVKSELPAGYLRAEFLESTGTQYIDTMLVPDSSSELKLNFAVMEALSYRAYYGAREDGEKDFYCRNNGTDLRANVYIGRYYTSAPYELKQKNELIVHAATSNFELNGKSYSVTPSAVNSTRTAYLFAHNSGYGTHVSNMRCWSFDISNSAQSKKFIPALDSGVPCMFETTGKTPHCNIGTGQFIVGFTLQQVSKLGKHLPEGGGSLTISLPTGYEQDAAVAESLETARAKGWTLTVQTYTPEAEAAATTFGMRRVWVRRTQDEQGGYVDADGVRCSVEWCNAIYAPDGSEPDAHGYEPFRSVEAACEYWGLAAYVDPEAEQELLTNQVS